MKNPDFLLTNIDLIIKHSNGNNVEVPTTFESKDVRFIVTAEPAYREKKKKKKKSSQQDLDNLFDMRCTPMVNAKDYFLLCLTKPIAGQFSMEES